MSEALEKAFASNTETPLNTISFSHSALTGGVLYYVQAYQNLTATLEDSTTVSFSAIELGINLPTRDTDGSQSIDIQINNVSNNVYQEMRAVKVANRTSQEKVICTYRAFLESDTSAPAGTIYKFSVESISIDRNSAVIRATYSKIPDLVFPRLRYFTDVYPGLKYV